MTVQSNPTPFTATIGITPQAVLVANPNRTFLQMQNKSVNQIRIKIGGPFLAPQTSIQTVNFSAVPTAGNFYITIGAVTSAEIAWNASNSTIQTAIQGMSNVGAGNCAVTGSFLAGLVFTFEGTLVNTTILPIQITTNTLTNNATQASAIQTLSWSLPPDGGTFTVTGFSSDVTAALASNTTAAQLETALNALASINNGVASVAQDPSSRNFQITFGSPLNDQALANLTVQSSLTQSAGNSSLSVILYAEPEPLQGTFQIAFAGGPFAGVATAPIAFGATAAQVASAVQTAIQAVGGYGSATCTGSGSTLVLGYTLTFGGTAANMNLGVPFVYNSTLQPDILDGPQLRVPGGIAVAILTSTPGQGTSNVTGAVTTFQAGVAPVAVTTSTVQTVAGQPGDYLTGGIILQPFGTANEDMLFYDSTVPIGQVNALADEPNSLMEVWAG